MTHVLGLTGSIGMGKTTTATMFREAGIPVWDADRVVHDLYRKHGAAVAPISNLYPAAIVDGMVSRPALNQIIQSDPAALRRIEDIVHPLVRTDREAFLAAHPDKLVVLDIPLLFETDAAGMMDTVLVVSAPPDVQAKRVLSRPGMTLDRFAALMSRQMPDAEKRARADIVIETLTCEGTRQAVHNLIFDLTGKHHA